MPEADRSITREDRMSDLRSSIAGLYAVFGAYGWIRGRELRALRSAGEEPPTAVFEKDLREVSAEDLRSHRNWSMGRSGLSECLDSLERTKYLLPRVLELFGQTAVAETAESIPAYEITSKLIEYAWWDWPDAEHASVRRWMDAVYLLLFTRTPAERWAGLPTPDDWLDKVLACDRDVSRCLEAWWSLACPADVVAASRTFLLACDNSLIGTGPFPRPLAAPPDPEWPAIKQIAAFYCERRMRDRWEALFFAETIDPKDRQDLARAVDAWDQCYARPAA
ncbi:MAG: hypothetical protein U0836_23570 [Pirellulales bacterium]